MKAWMALFLAWTVFVFWDRYRTKKNGEEKNRQWHEAVGSFTR